MTTTNNSYRYLLFLRSLSCSSRHWAEISSSESRPTDKMKREKILLLVESSFWILLGRRLICLSAHLDWMTMGLDCRNEILYIPEPKSKGNHLGLYGRALCRIYSIPNLGFLIQFHLFVGYWPLNIISHSVSFGFNIFWAISFLLVPCQRDGFVLQRFYCTISGREWRRMPNPLL